MRRELSIYLDLARILAAFLVFMGHANHFTDDLFGKAGAHASEAVAIFFVLSGFVIAFVSKAREPSAGSYVMARAVRIYSVAIPAIICAVICNWMTNDDYITSHFKQEVFDNHTTYFAIFSSLFFLGELWSNHIFVGGNEPYWSIGFEVWYYVLFGILWFSTRSWKYFLFLIITVVLGPKIMIFFPLWCLGVLCYKIVSQHQREESSSHMSLLSGSILFVSAGLICVFLKRYVPLTETMYSVPDLTKESFYNWIYFTAVGIAFALSILGVDQLAPAISGVTRRIEPLVRWIAGGTFTLYLTHQPILMFLTSASRDLDSSVRVPLITIGTLTLVTLIAELGERRKRFYLVVFRKAIAGTLQLSVSTYSFGRSRRFVGRLKRF